MCLIAFSWQPDAKYPLTLVANRDEFYIRPTKSVHFWEDNPNILGGRDLQSGGSWMAINRSGRFAAVTNYRQLPHPKDVKSRGKLVSDFLETELSPKEFLSTVDKESDQYPGFNLLAGDTTELSYYSNRMKSIVSLEPGIYGLCNHLLNTEWPKLSKAKQNLEQLLDHENHASPDALINLMADSTQPPEDQLPDTGVGLETEKLLSSCFISSNNYGTRNTSVLTFSREGVLSWTEQLFLEEGVTGQRFDFSVQLYGNAKRHSSCT